MNQSTALKRLNKLIKTLPEYKAIADALPNNVTIQELTLVEHATKKNTSCKHVSYQGLNPTKGKNNEYLIECCGLGYFQSKKTIEEISQICEQAYEKAVNMKTRRYGMDLTVFMLISDELGVTDEVYPHMREHAIGVFKINGL